MADGLNVIATGDESGSPLGNKDNSDFIKQLVQGMWQYRSERFDGEDELFDSARPTKLRPPVFRRPYAGNNVILNPNAADDVNQRVVAAVPVAGRHRWFASMKSSQALAQSVFANLVVYDKLSLLEGLASEDGETAFFDTAPSPQSVGLEAAIRHLGEPRSTSVDVMIDDGLRVAVECKLTEWETGSCSRPLTEDDDPKYCDGSYRQQGDRWERCQLSSIGVRYWDYIPKLFHWPADQDQRPCPMRFTFQLVRNILSACITPDGGVHPSSHAVMVYDARNPSFAGGGAALRCWQQTREGLREKSRLRRVSWQSIVARLAEDAELAWLSSELRLKYGFS
jgi:hypothetical protein